jgi:hypothetical protein
MFTRGMVLTGLLLVAGLLFGESVSRAAATKKFALGVGFDYATGDYGTSQSTDSLRVPVTIDYFPSNLLSFELVVPYLYQSNSNTIFSGGMRFPTRRGGTGGMGGGSFDSQASQSGLGDITLTTGYVILKEGPSNPALRPLLYLKLPTADKDKGLGTGEFDVGVGLGAVKWFDPWYTFAEIRHVFQGDNATLGLKDYTTLEGAVGYRVGERFLPSLDLWWSSAPSDDASQQLEARLKGKYWLSDVIAVEGHIGTGLADGSPDFTLGGAVYYSF